MIESSRDVFTYSGRLGLDDGDTRNRGMRRRRREAKQEQIATSSKQGGQAMKEERREVDGKEGRCLVERRGPSRRSELNPAGLRKCKRDGLGCR